MSFSRQGFIVVRPKTPSHLFAAFPIPFALKDQQKDSRKNRWKCVNQKKKKNFAINFQNVTFREVLIKSQKKFYDIQKLVLHLKREKKIFT